jgi:hypothetical protein
VTPIDDYLAKVEPEKRKALQRIRTLAKKAVPEANHIGVYPYSGGVIETRFTFHWTSRFPNAPRSPSSSAG